MSPRGKAEIRGENGAFAAAGIGLGHSSMLKIAMIHI
jgi:hypothetical protein